MPRRPVTLEWGRFDVAGWVTIYGAATRLGAYLETLAHFQPDPRLIDRIDDLFSSPAESVASQWNPTALDEGAGVPPRVLHPDWRLARMIADIDVRRVEGRPLVDVSAAATLGHLRAHGASWIPEGHRLHPIPSTLTLSDLTGPDRVLTTALADWLRLQVLPDGQVPAGIRYVSKHGADLTAYALWVDVDRFPQGTIIEEATATLMRARSEEITPHDMDLHAAADFLGLRVL